ncbi:MAG: UDP-N-acetylmuramoyl-L-alanine--D-glutamate ligase [Parerythrobacter sp.]
MMTGDAFRGKRYAVLGLARSGLAAAQCLLASGAQVTAWDRQEEARDTLAAQCNEAAALDFADPLEIDLAGYAGIVVSPGVPLNTHPIATQAVLAEVPIIGDIELFAQLRDALPAHRVVGITGTNGKSTTTALLHHILKQAGMPTLMGGNIGEAILAQTPLPEGGVYVLELSSYQIDLTRQLDCEVAVLLNISPDHLDRYDGMEAYTASKLRLFAMQTEGGDAVLPAKYLLEGAHLASGVVGHAIEQAFEGAISTGEQSAWPSLQGPHNLENAGAAIAVCRVLGLSDAEIQQGLRSFAGLPHRMERLGEHGGVLFINDSKATNPASCAPALAAFPAAPEGRIRWIVGGLAKEDGLGECAQHLGNIACAYTIGEAGPRFAELLEPHVRVVRAEMLCEAVARAIADAKPGDVVLLSPACASFDQFRDYEKRGQYFAQLVALATSDTVPASGIDLCNAATGGVR